MIRLFYYENSWFNVDNEIDSQRLLDDGAVEFTSDQIRNVEGHENKVSDETMFQDENGWYYYEAPVVVTVEQRIKEIQDAVQNLLDAKAHEKLYDNGFAIASYATSTVESFRTEAQQFIAWRDACWLKCYEILDLFQTGQIEMPSVEYVMERLPTLTWNS